jgi:excisionase family DNA binding protein
VLERYEWIMDKPEASIPVLFATYKEAATVCRLSESMIRKLVRERKLKVRKFGRSARIPVSELSRIGTGK